MTRSIVLFAAVALSLTLAPTGLFAQCTNQPREVALGKENTVALRSYLCSAGSDAGAAQFRVEYYRLAEGAVSLLLANGSSVKLRKTLGPAKIIPNEVSHTYATLLGQFGTTADVPNNDFASGDLLFTVAPSDQAGSRPDAAADNAAGQDNKDKAGLKKLRTLIDLWGPTLADDYPALAEIIALQRKTIASNLSYYYSLLGPAKDYPQHADGCDKQNLTCKFGKDIYQIKFWRPLTIGDTENFSANAKSYNAALLKVYKNKADAKLSAIGPDDPTPKYDRLLKFISGGELPNDFSFLLGKFQDSPDCGSMNEGDLPFLAGWRFNTARRDVKVDALFVENLSKQPLAIGQLLGERNASANLRVAASAFALPADAVGLDGTSATIAPGQTAIILTRIVFLLPADQVADFRRYRESMDALHTAFGSDGFGGNVSAFQAPNPKDYTYGPTLTVTGALVNSKRVDFAARPTLNFIEMSRSQEGASCPYLLSFDEGGQEWVGHGKILQRGQGRANAYTETVTFPGLRTRFRLEEREPELAHLQGAKLIVEFSDGSTQTFSPVQSAAFGGDDETSLMWGEASDIAFAVPNTVAAKDVRQSRLQIAGYYERYSTLLVARHPPAVATPLPLKVDSITAPD